MSYEKDQIRRRILNEIEEIGVDAATAIAQEIDPQELAEAIKDGTAAELLDDYVCSSGCYFEAFDHIDVYYSKTFRRGDTGLVAEVARDLIEDYGYDYMIKEDERLQELEGIYRANYLVNLAGSILAGCMRPDLEEIANNVHKENILTK